MSTPIADLDVLIEQLQQALSSADWDTIAELNATVPARVEPVMVAMEQGHLSPTLVQQRLEQLQQFCDQAEAGAEHTRSETLKALKEVSRNQSAARAYQDVSGRKPG